jgi:glycosyltransferase involved in cell wall biosynthesis
MRMPVGRRLSRSALGAHLRAPLYREGYALPNCGLLSLFAVVYWLVAARHYTPHNLGLNAAAISAVMFLAGVSQLNLVSALMRLLPVAAIQAARPFAYPGHDVLTVGRLERLIDRTITAMASLASAFRLAVVGAGSDRDKLLAHSLDLQVSSRVKFAGSVPDADLYWWLRTGRVAVAVPGKESSGLQVTEALSAGAPVVASDIPLYRGAASYADGAGVQFVSPAGSPLEIAEGICETAELGVPRTLRLRLPTWDYVVERTLALYVGAMGRPRAAGAPEAA